MWDLVGVIIISTGISLGFTIYFQRKSSKQIGNILQKTYETLRNELDEELEPIKKVNSIAMSQLQSKGVETRQLKALDKDLGKDILNQYSMEMEIIDASFPNVAERLRGNPQLILQWFPRVKQLLANTDFAKLGDLTGTSQSRKHPFEDER